MDNFADLFAALAAARLEFGPLTKGKRAQIKSDKGSYEYTYADLSDVIEATAGALARNGITILQEPEAIASEQGRTMVAVYGRIVHKSGAMLELRPMVMPVAGSTAQAIGSAISYARRYQLQAALNLAADDDDGEAATNARTPVKAQTPVAAQKTQQREPSGRATPATKETETPVGAATEFFATWKSPDAAMEWAVAQGASENIHAAREAFKRMVNEQFDGKLTKSNIGAAYQAWYDDRLAKLAAVKFDGETPEERGATGPTASEAMRRRIANGTAA